MSRLWEPKVGNLVHFRRHEISNNPDIPVRVPRPTQHGYVKDHVRSTWLFLVFGQLDFEEKLAAAYAQEQAGGLDPVSVPTRTRHTSGACAARGVVVLTRQSLVPA